jgi:N-methylhydantoinase A
MNLRVAVDIGGTFTDVCVFDENTGSLTIEKVASSKDPITAVLEGVAAAGARLSDVALFCHGTTVATNALITRRFQPSAMVTTRGFRDIIEIRRGTKDDLWDAYADVAPPYIRRRDRFEVTERIDQSGRVVAALDEDEARDLARILGRRGVKSVAVCFVNAYANPEHEQRMQELLAAALPGVHVSTSSDVLSEIFEHERFSTTVANAVLAPLVTQYVDDLDAALSDGGYQGELLLLHSGGGVMTPKAVQTLPVRLAASGLAAGAIACRHLASSAGYSHAIGLDIGGTSADISLVADGQLRTTDEWSVEYGYPICLPSVEVLTIGAGGGSIGWIDDAGSLRSGPQSAGAIPGPACYGAGGTAPTSTDANLVLGRLGDGLAGDRIRLDRDASVRAIDAAIGEPLGLSTHEAARAMLAVSNANMADAVRLVSIQRGYDPRDFALVAFGGAGPLHGAAIATELSIPTVLVPPNPGISSAFGCLLVDIQHDLSSMVLSGIEELSVQDINTRFGELEAEAVQRLQDEGVAADDMELRFAIDMRYGGQWRSLSVPVPRPLLALTDAVAGFHERHEREHSFRRDDAPVEVYRVRVTAVGRTPKPNLPERALVDAEAVPASRREVWFDGEAGPVLTEIYERQSLLPGMAVQGPAIVEQLDSTTVIPPGSSASVDERFNLLLHLNGDTPS